MYYQESKDLTSHMRWRFVLSSASSGLRTPCIRFPFSFFMDYPLCWHRELTAHCSIYTILGSSKALLMFEDDPRFLAVEKDREREELFEDYIVELERKVCTSSFSVKFSLDSIKDHIAQLWIRMFMNVWPSLVGICPRSVRRLERRERSTSQITEAF